MYQITTGVEVHRRREGFLWSRKDDKVDYEEESYRPTKDADKQVGSRVACLSVADDSLGWYKRSLTLYSCSPCLCASIGYQSVHQTASHLKTILYSPGKLVHVLQAYITAKLT